jgi:hypothetical protein
MAERKTFAGGRVMGLVSVILGGVVLITAACSSEKPKPLAQPTPDQVRGHSDRMFDKLKQEEQERAAQPPVPR